MLRTAERPPWMTVALLQQIRQKRRLWSRYKSSPSDQNKECYKSAQKNVHKQIKKVKKLFKQNLAKNKTESKRFYSFMKTKTSTHAEVGPLKVGGATITDSKAKPDSLNTYFGSVFQCKNPSTLPAATELNSHLKCRGVNFLPSAVKKAIKKQSLRPAQKVSHQDF